LLLGFGLITSISLFLTFFPVKKPFLIYVCWLKCSNKFVFVGLQSDSLKFAAVFVFDLNWNFELKLSFSLRSFSMLYCATKRVDNQLGGVQAQSTSICVGRFLFHIKEQMDLVFSNWDTRIRDSNIQSIFIV
jgi:hypothetical protein